MQVGTGISILNGIAIGKIKIFKAPTYEISDSLVEDPIPELDRYEKARVKAQEQQNALYEKAVKAAGEDSAGIFEFHAEMLDDDDLNDSVKSIIADQKHTAEYAVKQGFANMAQMFKEMDNPYFQARSTDVIDVGNCVLDILLGNDTESMQGTEPIQCKQIDDSWDGKFAILDGYNSCVYVEPTQDLIDTLTAKHNEDLKKEALLKELKGKTNTTIDGRTIKVFANIGGPQDIGAVQENDAEGIGLFRSEFVYLGSTKEPTEDEQFEAYKRVVETLAPKLVVIRTCDIGADKTIDWMNLDHETNPALGYRAIRICLTRKDFFKRQLRALLRASAYGNMGIMFPMIISVREVREAKEILAECRRELENENVKMGNPQIGIMVETPAAVLCADELAEEVDFFSLGTNDLTQYTTAIDRVNAKLEPFADSHHPAVLREIKMTIDAGHRHNCWVGICGELGADLALTETFRNLPAHGHRRTFRQREERPAAPQGDSFHRPFQADERESTEVHELPEVMEGSESQTS